MKPPRFIRSLTADERKQLELGLLSRKAFIVRRCQILLASSRGERVSAIARSVGYATQTCRNVIRDFETRGLASLEEGSRRPKSVQPMLDSSKCQKLQALLHSSPREFGNPTSLWTLQLAAEVIYEQGLVEKPVSREVIRKAIRRFAVKWKSAKNWITGPDAQYALKKSNSKG